MEQTRSAQDTPMVATQQPLPATDPASDRHYAASAGRPARRVLSTSVGANPGAFSTRDWLQFLSVGVIWGSAYLLIDIGLESLHPGVIAWLRIVLGAFVLWLLPAARRRSVGRDDWPRLVVVSVVWIAVPFTLFPVGQQYINSALTGMINSSMPIFATAIGALMLLRIPGRRQIAGLAIGIAGVVAVTAPAVSAARTELLGVVIILAAVVFYGLAVNIAAPLQQRYGSIAVMARVLAVAGAWTAPLGLWGMGYSSFEVGPVLAVAVLGAIGTGLAFALMASLIGSVGAGRASFVTYLLPPVALALGVTLRGDQVTALSVVGVVLIVAGAFLASRAEATPRAAVEGASGT